MKNDFDIFHGKTLKSRTMAGLTLTETGYVSNLSLPRHAHQSAYFCFVLEGGFTEVCGQRSNVYERSTLIYHPAGENHADSFYAASRCFNLRINTQWLDRIGHRKSVLDEPANFRGGVLPQIAAKLYHEFNNQDDLSSLVIEGLTLEILAGTARHSGRSSNSPQRWLREARELVYSRFNENLSLSEIARSVGVHETHLSREFRRHYGCSIGEYVRQLRIEYACRLLTTSNVSLSEIAVAVGFFDQSHFSRNFKFQIGMTPHEYRRVRQSR